MSGKAPVELTFSSVPSVACAYGKAVFAFRPALVRAGGSVPRIEATLASLELTEARTREFSHVAGSAPGHCCPLILPHVAAMPLHLAVLTNGAFPVRLLGLVHVDNEIEQQRWLVPGESVALRASIEGFEDTARGHEFVLETEARGEGGVLWRERSRLLARRPKAEGGGAPSVDEKTVSEGTAVSTTAWHCDAAIGRRYGWLSGDLNPIHLTDVTAKLFGFDRAIAHGMWMLSRIAHELGAGFPGGAIRIAARFRAPVMLPSWVTLQSWNTSGNTEFRLRDSDGARIHMEGEIGPITAA